MTEKYAKTLPSVNFFGALRAAYCPFFFGIFDFVLDRERLGITKSENAVFDLFLLSAFGIFAAV